MPSSIHAFSHPSHNGGTGQHHEHTLPVTEQGRGWFTINYYRKDSPFLSLEVPSPTPTC